MEVARSSRRICKPPVDRIDPSLFSGEFTQCPITTDRNALIEQIQNLESRKHLADGTVIGEGLATAARYQLTKVRVKSKGHHSYYRWKKDPPETTGSSDPLTALEIAPNQRRKVYTIGMGLALPLLKKIQVNKKVRKALPSISSMRPLLQRIATETRGQYFRARTRMLWKYLPTDKPAGKIKSGDHQFSESGRGFAICTRSHCICISELLLRFTLFRKFP